MRARSLVLLVSLLVACAGTPQSPFFDDEQYLRFGVEPQAEAKALIEEYRKHGYELVRELEGQHFAALGFARGGTPSVVRVITARGIALALDPKPALGSAPAEHFELLAAPVAGTHDADADGFEEVFVLHRLGASRCVQVHRVRDVGFVDAVPVGAEILGELRCPSEIADIDGDGRIELVVDLRLSGFTDPAPTLRVPLWANDHRFTTAGDPLALARYFAAERAAREHELAQARRMLDPRWVSRLAVELAAIAALEQRGSAAAAAAFDAALLGLVLDATEAVLVLRARERVLGFGAESPSPAPSEAAKNAPP